ncbi:MAG TPA: CpsD/CapB family tyrosine-protein kinase [Alphaproteobacteria bacterium]|nr:CpsD/CapB family tyrosine-protein kinase [Alphaproteobacteria bacterium]
MRRTDDHLRADIHRRALPPPKPSGKASDRPSGDNARVDEAIASLRSLFRLRRSKRQPGPNNQKVFEQQIHALLVSILGMIDKEGSAVIAITGSTRGEGATTIASSLAKVASQQGWCRVVLMDGSRPSQEREPEDDFFAAPPERNDAATGSNLPTLLKNSRELALMPTASRGVQLRSPETLRTLYTKLREAVNLVIIDCPPIMEANETLSLAAAADGVILVVEENRARIAVVRRARVMLERAGAKMIGVVLNKREQIIPSFLYDKI